MSIRFDILRHICSSNNDMQVIMELKKLGKMSKTAFLEMLGSMMAGEIKDAMTNGQWAPLSPKTIKRRRHGGSQPLIDTGTLRASVSFEIEK